MRYPPRRIQPTLLAAARRPGCRCGGADSRSWSKTDFAAPLGVSVPTFTEWLSLHRGARAGSETTALRPGIQALPLGDVLARLGWRAPGRRHGSPASSSRLEAVGGTPQAVRRMEPAGFTARPA